MVHKHLSRRQFVGTAAAVTTAGLAGCSDGGGTGTGETGDGAGTDEMGGSPGSTEDETGTESTMDDEDTETGGGDALVRAVHASPDAPNVDVYVEEEPVLTDVAFRTVSDYLAVPAGTYPVQITAAGDQETVVFDEDVSVSEGTATSLVALGEIGAETFEVRAFEDDVTAPGEDESLIRALHASPDAPAVDVAVEGEDEPLVSELAFGEASDYATVPAGSYTLEIRAAGETEAVASFDVDLEGATGYTAFAMGYLNPEEAAADEPFDLTVATDTTETGAMTTEDEAATTTEGGTSAATEDGTATATTTGTEAAAETTAATTTE